MLLLLLLVLVVLPGKYSGSTRVGTRGGTMDGIRGSTGVGTKGVTRDG